MREWLNSKCNSPNCQREEQGPTVTIKIQPRDPVIGSCKLTNNTNYQISSTKTSNVSCQDATNKALTDIGEQISDIPDQCPNCGNYWTISNLTNNCSETPPGSHTYIAQVSVDINNKCGDKRRDKYYKGWVEWTACYRCVGPGVPLPAPAPLPNFTPSQ